MVLSVRRTQRVVESELDEQTGSRKKRDQAHQRQASYIPALCMVGEQDQVYFLVPTAHFRTSGSMIPILF